MNSLLDAPAHRPMLDSLLHRPPTNLNLSGFPLGERPGPRLALTLDVLLRAARWSVARVVREFAGTEILRADYLIPHSLRCPARALALALHAADHAPEPEEVEGEAMGAPLPAARAVLRLTLRVRGVHAQTLNARLAAHLEQTNVDKFWFSENEHLSRGDMAALNLSDPLGDDAEDALTLLLDHADATDADLREEGGLDLVLTVRRARRRASWPHALCPPSLPAATKLPAPVDRSRRGRGRGRRSGE